MFVTSDESCTAEIVEIVDLGDATVETKQIWFGTIPDSVFGLGFFRN
jgi:hypothetical protein